MPLLTIGTMFALARYQAIEGQALSEFEVLKAREAQQSIVHQAVQQQQVRAQQREMSRAIGDASLRNVLVNSGLQTAAFQPLTPHHIAMAAGLPKIGSADQERGTISFPKREHDSLQSRLAKGQPIFTTRVSDERGRYKTGQVLATPWGDAVKVTRVQRGETLDDHPHKEELNKAQQRWVGDRPFDFVRLQPVESELRKEAAGLLKELEGVVADEAADEDRELTPVEQERADREFKANLAGYGVAGGALGVPLVASPKTRGNLLGYKRVYHGTSAENLPSIREKGLLTSFGGTGESAHPDPSTLIPEDRAPEKLKEISERFARDAKDKVYVTPFKSEAKQYARTVGGSRGGKGAVVTADLPLDFVDDMSRDHSYNAFQELMMGDTVGLVGDENIPAKYLHGRGMRAWASRVKDHIGGLPEYIKKNPDQFLHGAGSMALGLGLLGGGVAGGKYLYDHRNDPEPGSSELRKEASRWKDALRFGEIGDDERSTLVDRGLLDFNREGAGLERGTDEIARKHGISFVRARRAPGLYGVDQATKDMAKTIAGKKPSSKLVEAITVGTGGFTAFPEASAVGVGRRDSRTMSEVLRQGDEHDAANQLDAVMRRHEVDEVLHGKRNVAVNPTVYPAEFSPSIAAKGELPDVERGNQLRALYPDTPDPVGQPLGAHTHPRVITNEARNMATLDPSVATSFGVARLGENLSLSPYGYDTAVTPRKPSLNRLMKDWGRKAVKLVHDPEAVQALAMKKFTM